MHAPTAALPALAAAAAASSCAGSVKQQLTITRQGNGWFTSIGSERKAPAAPAVAAAPLLFWAQEDGMMTYGDSRNGAVLSFTGCAPADGEGAQAYLHVVWNASGWNAGAAVLRIDATNCGAQRTDVGLFNQDCVARNTNTAADAACYCQPAPCVLKGVAPEVSTWYLSAADAGSLDARVPVPAAYFGAAGLSVRVTPLLSVYSQQLSMAANVTAAAVEYLAKGSPPPPPPKNASAIADVLCYGYN